jgi:hypothetical protein
MDDDLVEAMETPPPKRPVQSAARAVVLRGDPEQKSQYVPDPQPGAETPHVPEPDLVGLLRMILERLPTKEERMVGRHHGAACSLTVDPVQEEMATVVSTTMEAMPATPQLLVTDRVGFGQRKNNLERSGVCAPPSQPAHAQIKQVETPGPEKVHGQRPLSPVVDGPTSIQRRRQVQGR